MQNWRNVERSFYEYVKGLLAAPTGGLPVPYNVYGEDAYTHAGFAPTFPYVWLLGYRVRPRRSRLPLIIVDVGNLRGASFEIGNREGAIAFAQVNIFASTRGERDDLAAYLLKRVEHVPVYDYTPATPMFLWHAELLDNVAQRNSIGEDAGQEGSLTNWMTVAYGFQLKE